MECPKWAYDWTVRDTLSHLNISISDSRWLVAKYIGIVSNPFDCVTPLAEIWHRLDKDTQLFLADVNPNALP